MAEYAAWTPPPPTTQRREAGASIAPQARTTVKPADISRPGVAAAEIPDIRFLPEPDEVVASVETTEEISAKHHPGGLSQGRGLPWYG